MADSMHAPSPQTSLEATMMQLHYFPGNASFAPHVLLHEAGAPFQLKLVQRMQGAHKQWQYLKLNPNGLIPVLVDGDLVLYETAAICLYLADKFAAAALAPPLGTAQRAHFYKWLMWLTNTLQATLIVYFYPERWVNDGDAGAAAQVKAQAMDKVHALLEQLEQLDTELASHGGPWLLGEAYSALDAYTFMLCRWTRGFETRPARDFTHIAPLLKRVLERPAVQRVFDAEELAAPGIDPGASKLGTTGRRPKASQRHGIGEEPGAQGRVQLGFGNDVHAATQQLLRIHQQATQSERARAGGQREQLISR